MELLVVLVILGLLASIVGPAVLNQVSGSKSKTAALQIEEYAAALDLYYLEVGRYPTTQEGLEALIEQPGSARFWNGPYLQKKTIREDPWGAPYEYRSPGQNGEYDLYSYGSDGRAGGSGDAADINSWE
jgi:general secretion pathway protein G